MSGLQTVKSVGQMFSKAGNTCGEHGPYVAFCGPDGKSHCPVCVQTSINNVASSAVADQAASNRTARMRSTVNHSGLPPRFMGKTFDGFEPADDKQSRVLKICKAYADRFNERFDAGGGLVMCGSPGTGKTHLAAAISNHLMASGRSAMFASVLAAVRRVKQTYSRTSTETEQEAIARFYEPDLLILDEVGIQFGSSAEQMILFEIINGRYGRVLPTILISNLEEPELDAFVGERVMDRMKEGGGVVLAFDWASKRHTIKTASKGMPAWTEG